MTWKKNMLVFGMLMMEMHKFIEEKMADLQEIHS